MNKWIQFLREWAKKHNTNYSCALADPKSSIAYRKLKENKKEPKKETIIKKKEVKELEKKIEKKDLRKNIIDGWNTLSLPIALYQFDKPVYDNIEKFIMKKMKQNNPIVDSEFLFFTKDYNDKIIEKYGWSILWDGIDNIIEYVINSIDDNTDFMKKKYIITYRKGNNSPIPANAISTKNREILYKKYLEEKKKM
jgi:hypothetical protein